jgi:hypothetical protein
MTSQKDLTINLYRLLEEYDNPQRIKDNKWISDREIESNRLKANYVNQLDQYGSGTYLSKCNPKNHPSCKNTPKKYNYMENLPQDVIKNIIKQANIYENLKKQIKSINNNINSLEIDINLKKQNIDKEIEDYNNGIISEEEYDIEYLLKDLEKTQRKLGILLKQKKILMSKIHKMTILNKNLNGGKNKKQIGGGINPGRVITGENLHKYIGRLIRLIDTQGYSNRHYYQIKDLSGSKYIQDLSGFGDGLRFGILLEEDEESNRYFAEDLEPYESLARLRYNNGRIYYFAVPKTFQDIRDHGVFPYYLELANVGLPPYDINPELPITGPYSQYEPDHNHIFSAYQIRKKLTQKKKLRDAKQKLALSKIPFDNIAIEKINKYLSNIEKKNHKKIIKEDTL